MIRETDFYPFNEFVKDMNNCSEIMKNEWIKGPSKDFLDVTYLGKSKNFESNALRIWDYFAKKKISEEEQIEQRQRFSMAYLYLQDYLAALLNAKLAYQETPNAPILLSNAALEELYTQFIIPQSRFTYADRPIEDFIHAAQNRFFSLSE